ncbi:MAG TPA: trehalose-phosphatase [Burkholderiales bacterium]|nr:trehalose-phosphatase [Burkholderiales bacterium]
MTKQALPQPAAEWAFFLDLDGTLLEHAERPDAVRVGAAVRKLLAGLQEGAGGALALISGRSVADIDQLCAPLVLPAAGQHGVERRDAAGRMHRHEFPEQPLRHAAARLAAYAAQHPGLVLEDKGYSLALHFRLAPWRADEAREFVGGAVAELGDGFELQAGKMVYELKPGGRDKGTAIGDFMAERPFRDRTPVFIGDDLTDEFGFSVVNRLGGQSIKVGDGASVARWRIADAAAVRRWLAAWVGRFGRRTA